MHRKQGQPIYVLLSCNKWIPLTQRINDQNRLWVCNGTMKWNHLTFSSLILPWVLTIRYSKATCKALHQHESKGATILTNNTWLLMIACVTNHPKSLQFMIKTKGVLLPHRIRCRCNSQKHSLTRVTISVKLQIRDINKHKVEKKLVWNQGKKKVLFH